MKQQRWHEIKRSQPIPCTCWCYVQPSGRELILYVFSIQIRNELFPFNRTIRVETTLNFLLWRGGIALTEDQQKDVINLHNVRTRHCRSQQYCSQKNSIVGTRTWTTRTAKEEKYQSCIQKERINENVTIISRKPPTENRTGMAGRKENYGINMVYCDGQFICLITLKEM